MSNSTLRTRISRRMSRRSLLRMASGAVGAGLAATVGRMVSTKAEVSALENCFWRRESTVCSNGIRYELWCYICCAGLDCETLWCEWHAVGSC